MLNIGDVFFKMFQRSRIFRTGYTQNIPRILKLCFELQEWVCCEFKVFQLPEDCLGPDFIIPESLFRSLRFKRGYLLALFIYFKDNL